MPRIYTRVPPIDRFMPKVQKMENGCWEWIGASDLRGCGRFGLLDPRRTVLAHRWSYEWFVGPIPEGLEIDHLCFNPPCVNPEHLEAVTSAENTRRANVAMRRPESWSLYCVHGHRRCRETIRLDPRGSVHCRICDRLNKERTSERRRRARIERLGFDPGPTARFYVNSNGLSREQIERIRNAPRGELSAVADELGIACATAQDIRSGRRKMWRPE